MLSVPYAWDMLPPDSHMANFPPSCLCLNAAFTMKPTLAILFKPAPCTPATLPHFLFLYHHHLLVFYKLADLFCL